MGGGLPDRSALPGQSGRVSRLGGVRFLQVNALCKGGVPRLTGVMFFRAFIFSLNIWKPHPIAPGLLILHVNARFFFSLQEGGVPHM